jgi:hypothetical protein
MRNKKLDDMIEDTIIRQTLLEPFTLLFHCIPRLTRHPFMLCYPLKTLAPPSSITEVMEFTSIVTCFSPHFLSHRSETGSLSGIEIW